MINYYECPTCKTRKKYEESSSSTITRSCLVCRVQMVKSKQNPPFLTYKTVFRRNRKEWDYDV